MSFQSIKIKFEKRPVWLRFLVAIFAVAAALGIRFLLLPITGAGAPFVLFFGAVIVAGLYGGLGPGLLATFLGGAFGAYFFTSHLQVSRSQAFFQTLTFAIECVVMTWITVALQRSKVATETNIRLARFAEAEANELAEKERLSRMHAEEVGQKLEAANLALRESEAKHRELLESAPDAIFVVGEDGKIKFANKQTESWFGYSQDALVGQSVEILVPMEARSQHIVWRNLYGKNPTQKLMAARSGDLTARRKDGSEFPVSIALSPRRTRDGLFTTLIVRDVSEMKRLAKIAAQAREDAVAMISHDLKNPLAAIKLSLDVLKRRPGNLEPAMERTTTVVEKALFQMNSLIEDLLDFAKIDAKKFIVEKKPEDAGALLEEVFMLFQPLAREKNIDLRVENRAGATQLHCEHGRILRVFSNLLSNAIKFTPKGGRVVVALEKVEGNLLFSVTDSGPGISADSFPHVFERYWQSKETARAGTGLGLAIAKGIVEAHKGQIWVESALGEGSKFSFQIPGPESAAESA